MTPLILFDNSYARLPDHFFARVVPAAAPAPRLIRINHDLAAELGIDAARLAGPEGVEVLSGREVGRGLTRSPSHTPVTNSATSSPMAAPGVPTTRALAARSPRASRSTARPRYRAQSLSGYLIRPRANRVVRCSTDAILRVGRSGGIKLSNAADRDYYRARARTEFELAAQSTDSKVAAVHADLAQMYVERLSAAGELTDEEPLRRAVYR